MLLRFIAFTPSQLDTTADSAEFTEAQAGVAEQLLQRFAASHAGMDINAAILSCVPLGTSVDVPGMDPALNHTWRTAISHIAAAFRSPPAPAAHLAVTSFLPFVHGGIPQAFVGFQRVSVQASHRFV